MKLTAYTDYTLRVLMYLGRNRERFITIQDIAILHGISKNHLMKVAHQLGLSGVVETVRGRHGGLKLRLDPAEVNIGEVIRSTEADFFMAECFDHETNTCVYTASCVLKGVLNDATAAYLAVLDRITLKDLLSKKGQVCSHSSKAGFVYLHAPTHKKVQKEANQQQARKQIGIQKSAQIGTQISTQISKPGIRAKAPKGMQKKLPGATLR